MSATPFAKTVGALLVGSGAQLIGSVGSALLATMFLPVNQRGLMVVVMTIGAFIGLVGSAGAGNAYRHRYPSAVHPQRLAAAFTWLALALVLVSAVAAAASCALLGVFSDVRLLGGGYLLAAALAGVTQVCLLLVTEARFARGDFLPAARWAALSAGAGFIGVCVALLFSADAAGVVILQSCLQGGVLLLAVLAARRSRSLVWRRARPADVRGLLNAGLRSLALPLAIIFVSRFDRLALAVGATTEVVAVYALAATIVEIARLVPTAIGQLTTREVAMGAEWLELRQRLVQAAVAASVVGAALSLISFLLVPGLFDAAYAGAPGLTIVLLISEIVSSVVLVANLAVIGGGWSTLGARVAVVAIAVTVPAYLCAAALGGAYGVAMARAAVFTLLALMLWNLLRRRPSSLQ